MQRCQLESPVPTVEEPKVTTIVCGFRWRVLLAYAVCAVIWGTTWYAIRICIEPGGYPSYAAAAIRFTICSIVLAAGWFLWRKRAAKPEFHRARWITIAGLLSGVGYGLLYSAEEQITGGLAAVLSAMSPLIAATLASMTGTEKSSRTAIAGSAVALLGVVCVFHDRLLVSQAQAVAVGMMLVICVLNACSNVAMKLYSGGVNALVSNAIFFIAASVSLWVASALSGKFAVPLPLPFWPTVAMLYLSVFGTLIAFGCFFYLLKHVRLSTAMTLAFVTPLIALGVDALWEKHAVLTQESFFGIAIVIIGVAVSVISSSRKKSEEQTLPLPSVEKEPSPSSTVS